MCVPKAVGFYRGSRECGLKTAPKPYHTVRGRHKDQVSVFVLRLGLMGSAFTNLKDF